MKLEKTIKEIDVFHRDKPKEKIGTISLQYAEYTNGQIALVYIVYMNKDGVKIVFDNALYFLYWLEAAYDYKIYADEYREIMRLVKAVASRICF